MLLRLLTIAIVVTVLGVPQGRAAVRLDPFLSGLTFPVFVTNAGDGSNRIFVIQKAGTILVKLPTSSTVEATPFLNITSRVRSAENERGLLGLAFHPNFAVNGRFFVYYTRVGDFAIQIAEYHCDPGSNVADSADEKVILTIPHPNNDNHNGGTVAFGMDGYLYAGTGDGGSANDPPANSQNINVLLGKMLRLDVNVPAGQTQPYNIPPDNPYVGIPGADEIFAIGLRNPYRFSFDNGKQRGSQRRSRLWVADVGQGSIEEVDLVKKGGNYGWRAYEGNECTGLSPELCANGANPIVHAPPLFQYFHSSSSNGTRCSITGGYVYRGALGVVPQGNYVYADYCSGEIMMWDGSAQSVILDTTLLVTAIGTDEAGELYVVGRTPGTVQKLAGSLPVPDQEPTPQTKGSRR